MAYEDDFNRGRESFEPRDRARYSGGYYGQGSAEGFGGPRRGRGRERFGPDDYGGEYYGGGHQYGQEEFGGQGIRGGAGGREFWGTDFPYAGYGGGGGLTGFGQGIGGAPTPPGGFGRGGYGYRAGGFGGGSYAPQTSRGRHAGRGPKGYRRSDERIREDVNEALTDHPELDASNIEVEVKDGEVTISGTVESRWAKRLAEDALDGITGIRDVHNRLRIQTSGGGSEREVRRGAEREVSPPASETRSGRSRGRGESSAGR